MPAEEDSEIDIVVTDNDYSNQKIDKVRLEDESVFDYELFLRRMRHPTCSPILSQTKELISRISTAPPPRTDVSMTALVHLYREELDRIAANLRENPVWRLLGEGSPSKYEEAREGIEYLVMNQVHDAVFAVLPSDRQQDERVGRQMARHASWLEAAHLDVKQEMASNELVKEAVDQFGRINEYFTPRDKLICLLNGCRAIQGAIIQSKHRDNDNSIVVNSADCTTKPKDKASLSSEDEQVSADDIMPLLIFCLVKSQPIRLPSNLQYISRFRNQRELANDNAYHFTSLLAATTFIERMDATTLIINSEEYSRLIEQEEAKLNLQSPVNNHDDNDNNDSTIPSSPQTLPPPSAGSSRPTISSEDQLKEEATRIFLSVKEKFKLGASRSIEYLGELMDKAEAKLKSLGSPSEDQDGNIGLPLVDGEERTRALDEEHEFQMQLAMALSLSEAEYNQQQQKGGDTTKSLVDLQDDNMITKGPQNNSKSNSDPKTNSNPQSPAPSHNSENK